MSLSRFLIEVCFILALTQVVIFGFDEILRIVAVWLQPALAACLRAQSHDINQAYRYSPYWYIGFGGIACALLVDGIFRLFGSALPCLALQGIVLGVMGCVTLLPAWWCRGLLRVFLVGQGCVALAVVSWPLLFSSPPYASYLSMFTPLEPIVRWWMLSLLGGYTFCFIVTAQWRRPLPLRNHSGREGRVPPSNE